MISLIGFPIRIFRFSLFLVLLFALHQQAHATDQKAIIADIERVAIKVQNELTGKVILASGFVGFYLVRIDAVEDIRYDVRKSTSLVSPYRGIIEVTAQVTSNLKSLKANTSSHSGFTTAREALTAQDDSDFVRGIPGVIPDRKEYHLQKATISYSYQGGRWVLKSVEGGDFIYLTEPGNEAVLDLFM